MTALAGDPDASPCPAIPVSADKSSAGGELLALSATVLFLELALIRWTGAQVRAVAYFPNLILIGAFLGLGLGCLRAGRRSLGPAWAPLLLVLVAGCAGLGRIVFTQNSVEEHLWLLYYDLPKDAPVVHNVWLPVLLCFGLTVLAFIPPGQMVAERLRAFQRRGQRLLGYGWDLAGSLLGIVAFSVAAFARLAPVHWFAAAVLVSTFLYRQSRRRVIAHLAGGALLVGLVHGVERAQIYSPYYALSTVPLNRACQITANGSLHQTAFDTSRDGIYPVVAGGYHYPYTRSGHRPKRALVLGAGSGNDVATLLGQGAETIDAIEIDPAIIELGRRFHPNRPYDSPRVRVLSTDARAFLNETAERYDTIVFGTLDSMTRLSALSNVRLDNFVYTTDCLRAARRHLTDDGGLILYFMVGQPEIGLRIAALLTEVFGQPPVVHVGRYTLFNTIYLSGPSFAKLGPENGPSLFPVAQEGTGRMNLPDDDWPYLYLNGRTIGRFYWVVIAWILAVAAGSVLLVSPALRQGLVQRSMDVPMLLFGVAFLLLETRAVTAMNLLWGGTWLTSAVVFGAILSMVLLGTLAFARAPLRLEISIAGLVVSLLGLYLLPNSWLLTMDIPLRLTCSVVAVGAPVFFAATGFARIYSTRGDVGVAFGWNLLGAVAGGLLEFSSMVLGLRALLLIALVAYLAAYLFERQRMRTAGITPASPATVA